MTVHAASVLDAASGQSLPAELHDDLSADVLLDIEAQWRPIRSEVRLRLQAAGVPALDWPQSLHWNWSDKSLVLSLFRKPDSFRIFGLRRQDLWEGAMVTLRGEATTRMAPDAGKPIVVVDFLETAPWNWTLDIIGQPKKFKAVGSVLLAAAVAQSLAENCNGRLALHALPQAEGFYRGSGFEIVEFDEMKRMNYWELTAEAAAKLLPKA